VDLFPLVAAERVRLSDSLAPLTVDEWEAPSLCAGWSVHVVGAHLNAPWEASIPSVILDIARARSITGGFDRVARRLADRMTPDDCIAGLRIHADSHFTPPGFGPEAPLTDVIVHGVDMLLPSRGAVGVDPVALATCLEFLGSARAKNFVPKGLLDGLAVEASDLDVRVGQGRQVARGPALALCAALCGRPAVLDQLSGEGVAALRARL